jgi:glycoprotein-N-acetylgalactosamine 3-beta-galactosyltransferase
VVLENLRQMLYQYHAQTSLYIGTRMAVKKSDGKGVEEGFMHGGGHLFSKKAVKKFIEVSLKNSTLCPQIDNTMDDVFTGRCLNGQAIFVDDVDELNQKRFLVIGEAHLKPNFGAKWYNNFLWSNATTGGIYAYSDLFTLHHWVTPKRMYLLDYLIYNVHPFGLEKNLTETLPRKLPLKEIIEMSDRKSLSPNFVPHTPIHHLDKDEIYYL